MKRTSYFTFGQGHRHKVNGRIVDKDTVIKILDENPRELMFEVFGNKWSMEYTQPPNMRHFKEVVDIDELR